MLDHYHFPLIGTGLSRPSFHQLLPNLDQFPRFALGSPQVALPSPSTDHASRFSPTLDQFPQLPLGSSICTSSPLICTDVSPICTSPICIRFSPSLPQFSPLSPNYQQLPTFEPFPTNLQQRGTAKFAPLSPSPVLH